MNGSKTIINIATFLESHSLPILGGVVLLLWAASLWVVRAWTRRQVWQMMVPQEEQAEPKPLAEMRAEDQAALEVIRACRRRYLLSWRPGTELSFGAINDMSKELVQRIAQVYYPDEDRPELKASLADLVALHNRVGARLAAWLETFPMRAFKDLELQTVLRYHEMYRNLTEHPAYTFVRRHHLDKVVKWGVSLYNYANPWHWGGRAAFHGGREMTARLVLARVALLVGEEAMLLYGRRSS